EVAFRYANDRKPVAYLVAGDAPKPLLDALCHAAEAEKWRCTPAALDGKPVLRLYGFQEAGQVAAWLQIHHFTNGMPNIQTEPGDGATRSWKEWLEDTSLKAAGWGNFIGDTSLLMSGLLSGRKAEMTTGLLYTGGGGILARYGNVKTEY